MFRGTLRENLDPKLEYIGNKNSHQFKLRDKKIIEDLVSLGFDAEKLRSRGLDFQVEGSGSNLSLGER